MKKKQKRNLDIFITSIMNFKNLKKGEAALLKQMIELMDDEGLITISQERKIELSENTAIKANTKKNTSISVFSRTSRSLMAKGLLTHLKPSDYILSDEIRAIYEIKNSTPSTKTVTFKAQINLKTGEIQSGIEGA